MGQQEWNRAVAFESYEKERNKSVPPIQLAKDTDTWIQDAAAKEPQIREFLEKHGILTVPGRLQHYTLRPIPEFLRVLGFGENDDFTSPSRLNENCIRYLSEPSGNLGYFCARYRAGSAADHCSRRNSRTLFPALPFLETRRSDPAALLRLRGERRASAFTPRK